MICIPMQERGNAYESRTIQRLRVNVCLALKLTP